MSTLPTNIKGRINNPLLSITQNIERQICVQEKIFDLVKKISSLSSILWWEEFTYAKAQDEYNLLALGILTEEIPKLKAQLAKAKQDLEFEKSNLFKTSEPPVRSNDESKSSNSSTK